MDWQEKYGSFKEFESSPDYKKWLEEKLKDAPVIKAVSRIKSDAEIALEKRQEEINRLREEARNDPNAIISVTNTKTGEQEIMTQKEFDEYYDSNDIIEKDN